MLGAERLPGAEERGLRAVADDVVVEAARGDARALRQIRMLARCLVVEALEQHRDDAAQVGNDVLDVREALRQAAGDQVQHDRGVLERGADGDREAVVVDHRRADAVLNGVVVQHGPAPVHLLVEGLELRLRGGAIEAGAGHRHAEHAELVEPALHLAQRGVDVGQGQRHHRVEAAGMLPSEIGVAVVDEPRRRDGVGLLLGIGRARGRRQHLQLDVGLLHLLKARRDAGRVVVPHRPRGARPRRLRQATPADAQEQVVVFLGEVVGVDVDDHLEPPWSERGQPPRARPILIQTRASRFAVCYPARARRGDRPHRTQSQREVRQCDRTRSSRCGRTGSG